jgi:hypothetical protein
MARSTGKGEKKRVPSPTYEEQIQELVRIRHLPRTDKTSRNDDSAADTGEERSDSAAKTGEESDDDRPLFNDDDDEEEEGEGDPLIHTAEERREPLTPAERELIEMRRLFIQGLGFTDAAARYVTEEEQVDKASVLATLEYDQCEQIVKNTRKQVAFGKTITVADRALRNFQMAVTVAKHFDRTSRVLTPRDIDPDLFPAFKAQKEIEDQQRKDKPELPTGLTLDQTPKAARVFELVREHLGRYRGISGAPLSYVVRDQPFPPDGPDPMFTNVPRSRYESFDAEMIRRAPIYLDPSKGETGPFHPAFIADATKVWEVLHDLFSAQPIWVHVKGKRLASSRNGRACFMELHRHILGHGNTHTMGLAIMDKLNATKFDGPTKNWTFDKYVSAHVELHNQAEQLVAHGFQAITGHVKVNLFTRNISEKAGFGPVAMSIIADSTLQGDFDRVKQLYVDYYRRHLVHATGLTGGSAPRNVSAVNTGGNNGGNRGRKKRKTDNSFGGKIPNKQQLDACKVKLKDYSNEEYKQLDWISRYKLRQMRIDAAKSSGGGTTSRGSSSTVSAITQDTNAPDSATVGTHTTTGSNSTNPALVRPNTT